MICRNWPNPWWPPSWPPLFELIDEEQEEEETNWNWTTKLQKNGRKMAKNAGKLEWFKGPKFSLKMPKNGLKLSQKCYENIRSFSLKLAKKDLMPKFGLKISEKLAWKYSSSLKFYFFVTSQDQAQGHGARKHTQRRLARFLKFRKKICRFFGPKFGVSKFFLNFPPIIILLCQKLKIQRKFDFSTRES